jgi:hypothetical protein
LGLIGFKIRPPEGGTPNTNRRRLKAEHQRDHSLCLSIAAMVSTALPGW